MGQGGDAARCADWNGSRLPEAGWLRSFGAWGGMLQKLKETLGECETAGWSGSGCRAKYPEGLTRAVSEVLFPGEPLATAARANIPLSHSSIPTSTLRVATQACDRELLCRVKPLAQRAARNGAATGQGADAGKRTEPCGQRTSLHNHLKDTRDWSDDVRPRRGKVPTHTVDSAPAGLQSCDRLTVL